jgi:hypothetical protein
VFLGEFKIFDEFKIFGEFEVPEERGVTREHREEINSVLTTTRVSLGLLMC